MDNLNIGYSVGKVFSKATLQISATIQNVFMVTKYKGLDPEIGPGGVSTTNPNPNNSGIDNNLYPRPRIFALGLNLSL